LDGYRYDRAGEREAEILDIGERTLYRKLRDYGLTPEEALAGSAQ
jgi:DNA-binding NtrC family response regulator